MSNSFRKSFVRFGGLGPKSMPFLIREATVIDQKLIIMSFSFFTFVKVSSETIKNSKNHLHVFISNSI